ncbi:MULTISPECIES: MBL fold metallo-hydrolase [Bacillus]|uniref:MBL fold metallo-hydrolase n=1 Tax=Bacillus TaxID=1386 RepID=UPI0002EB9254|nr:MULTISPECIES: MBL fold metallo-hydrolase [Bacillus]
MKRIVVNKNMTIFQSELYKTNCIVIETKDCVLVVDPTWLPSEIEAIQHYVYKIKKNRTLYLLFTHSDWDHIIGYGAFLDAKTIGSIEMDSLPYKEEIVEEIMRFDHKYYLDRDYKIEFPKIEFKIKQDGDILEIGETKLIFYQAKGHTNDGIFTIVEPLGVLIAGDYLSDVEFPYIYHDSFEYESTLNKLDELVEKYAINFLVPGHGNMTDDQNEMMSRKQSSLAYIKSLRRDIEEGKTDVEMIGLISHYSYPKGMKSFHDNNIELMKKEMKNNE